jgi:GDP-L-fucose synthase
LAVTEQEYWTGKRVLVPGGSGFLGSHLVDALRILGADVLVPRSGRYDLRYPEGAAEMYVRAGRVDVVFHLAANVGGIGLNQAHPATLLRDNALMGLNVVEGARLAGVPKLVLVSTTCMYPKHAPVPFIEECVWDGYPEETNAAYATAKRMLMVYLQAIRQEHGFNGVTVIPTNLYGPRDTFNPQRSHVIPALVKKFVEAKEQHNPTVGVWGSGRATRDFLYVQDCVEALLLVAERYDRPEPLNLGSGREVPILYLADIVRKAVGYPGDVAWDTSRPDGQPRRALNSNAARRALGWEASTRLEDGIRATVEWYLENREGWRYEGVEL